PVMGGVGATAQRLPFHRSASVSEGVRAGRRDRLADRPDGVAGRGGAYFDAPLREADPLGGGCESKPTDETLGAAESSPGRGSRLPSRSRAGAPVAPGVPTAAHEAELGHETTPRKPPGLAGVVCPLHADPFHRSASGPTLVADAAPPTASQSEADAHDTPDRVTMPAPAGVGTVSRDQAEPFHRSARPSCRLFVRYAPTAVHASAAEQETASGTASVPAGTGTASRCQVAVARDSANGSCRPWGETYVPTAVQALVEAHDTALSSASPAPVGVG